MKVRDTQRQKVYNWESRLLSTPLQSQWDAPLITLDEAKAFANEIATAYAIRTPRIALNGRLQRCGVAIGLRKWVVAHEMAHVICGNFQQDTHGPEFVSIYCDILARWNLTPTKMTAGQIRTHARKIGKLTVARSPIAKAMAAGQTNRALASSHSERMTGNHSPTNNQTNERGEFRFSPQIGENQ